MELHTNPNAKPYKFTALAKKLSPSNDDQLISNQLRDGYHTTQLFTDINLELELVSSLFMRDPALTNACVQAQDAIHDYEDEIRTTSSLLGNAMHFMIQYRLFQILKNKGLLLAHEIKTGNIDKKLKDYKLDFIIMAENFNEDALKNILDLSQLNFKLTITDVLRLEFTASTNSKEIGKKTQKYAVGDQTSLIVLYGPWRNDPRVGNIKKLNHYSDLNSPAPSFSGVVTIEQLADLLKLQGADRQYLLDIATLYSNAFTSKAVYSSVLKQVAVYEKAMKGVYYSKMHNLIVAELKIRYIGLDLMWSTSEYGYD